MYLGTHTHTTPSPIIKEKENMVGFRGKGRGKDVIIL